MFCGTKISLFYCQKKTTSCLYLQSSCEPLQSSRLLPSPASHNSRPKKKKKEKKRMRKCCILFVYVFPSSFPSSLPPSLPSLSSASLGSITLSDSGFHEPKNPALIIYLSLRQLLESTYLQTHASQTPLDHPPPRPHYDQCRD